MTIQLMQQGPPPRVVFEQKAIEDRDATIKANRLVLRDVDYVKVFRSGTTNYIEKEAVEWLTEIERQSREVPPIWPSDWVTAFKGQYEQWKAGKEVTPMGFPIRHWTLLTKAQAENLIMARIHSVEELASASEEVLQHLGLGGRALKDRAKAWLESSKGNVGEELAALRAENKDLKGTVERQTEKLTELEAAIKSMQAGEPARKRA